MKYPLATNSWDNQELEALQEVIDSGRFTMGPNVERFETEFAEYFDINHAVMVNSGSSANLLIIAALAEKYKLKGNIIVPAVSWSTTYFPLHQYGFEMNFVDVDKDTLNMDPAKIEEAINEDTCAIFCVNLLGNPCDFTEIKQIAENKSLILIEDNCESLGAVSDTGELCGSIGKFGSFSFFFSHHLQTMEGGMIVCKEKEDADFIKSMRAHGWCRDLDDDNNIYTKTGDDFKDSFTFITPGYNVRPLEMSGAIGLVQLKKWAALKEGRNSNAKYFLEKFKDLPVRLQKETGESTWFGFSILLEGTLQGRRDEVVMHLKDNEIECRPIVAGNFMLNPVINNFDIKYIANGDYNVANIIHDNGIFVGNDSRDLRKSIDTLYHLMKDLV